MSGGGWPSYREFMSCRRVFSVAGVVALLVVTGLLVSALPSAATSPWSLDARLRAVLAKHMTGEVPGIAVRVESPRFRWSGAVGRTTLDGPARLSPRDPFRISSVTKTFTAVTVLRLVEQRRLGLDDPIAAYLASGLVDRLNVVDGVSYGGSITVRQLLDHTSGVVEYVSEAYQQAVATDPQHQWTPLEQIEFGLARGQSYCPPGRCYHYADTGYVLLGLVVEAATGRPLHELTRRLVLDPASLRHTYTEQLEPPPAHTRERAHQYLDQIDTTDFNPSFDLYGGGGLVSTPTDLARFTDALFHGHLLHDHTLGQMLTPSPHANYGLGLERLELDGETVWEHTGFFGTFLLYWPGRRLVITGSVNQATSDTISLAEDVARLLRNTHTA
jgi:D-alanyl-D-alanine carboxypeptidase